ncbi:Pantoate-beta-alanine ligase [Lentinula boryana]|uniref:Pantoate--beta-alanine ligase n=1 Tax=Lentinula boryana TaxID=40481 RepID=A0ABQ8PZF5_9AGAR|nr:Pantoate-beta-alanine ligase [Lentinula boryana]
MFPFYLSHLRQGPYFISGALESDIRIFTTVASYREWRRKAFIENRSVGFVPTMGALHEGHLDLVRRSLSENDLTVLSIFVNPAQFAPHEDLETYPRTLEHDLKVLAEQQVVASNPDTSSNSIPTLNPNQVKRPSAVFLPSVREMYPGGIEQEIVKQRGTFVEVTAYGAQMEGKSRPGFFRGVATVVTKLFNVIQPTNAYFGQKDIQQALLLRHMVTDLLLSHPSPDHLHIVPTARDPSDNLALSSRNAYLSPAGRKVAPTLYAALKAAEECWLAGEGDEGGKNKNKKECVEIARALVERRIEEAHDHGLDVEITLDYIEMNDAGNFEVLDDTDTRSLRGNEAAPVILSGAMWVDRTRLIDNLLLGDFGTVVR